MLALPHKRGFDELAAFRNKHLSDNSEQTRSWLTLAQTRRPLVVEPVREIEWTEDDLSQLLKLAGNWIDGLAWKRRDNKARGKGRSTFFSEAFSNGRERISDWKYCLQNLVLLNAASDPEMRTAVRQMIETARLAGFCVASSGTALAQAGQLTTEEAILWITNAIGRREMQDVQEGCQAIQTWALMDRAIGFPVPAVLTSSVVSVILSLRHEESAGLVRCLKAIVKHCSAETSGRLKNDLEQCLCVLLPATDYETDSVQRLSGGF